MKSHEQGRKGERERKRGREKERGGEARRPAPVPPADLGLERRVFLPQRHAHLLMCGAAILSALHINATAHLLIWPRS